jgi:hypothetical protein
MKSSEIKFPKKLVIRTDEARNKEIQDKFPVVKKKNEVKKSK